MNQPSLISTAAVAGLETLINRYLQLDPATMLRLAELSGKVIALEVRGPNITLYMRPDAVGIRVQAHYEGVVDTTISGAPFSMLRLGLQKDRQKALFSAGVEISGDTDTGQRFNDILGEIDIDWEEQLSNIVGDVLAHKLGNVVRGLRGWTADAGETISQNIAEYLHEEVQMVPDRQELEAFFSKVDVLRGDVDRLDQRILRLQRGMKGDMA